MNDSYIARENQKILDELKPREAEQELSREMALELQTFLEGRAGIPLLDRPEERKNLQQQNYSLAWLARDGFRRAVSVNRMLVESEEEIRRRFQLLDQIQAQSDREIASMETMLFPRLAAYRRNQQKNRFLKTLGNIFRGRRNGEPDLWETGRTEEGRAGEQRAGKPRAEAQRENEPRASEHRGDEAQVNEQARLLAAHEYYTRFLQELSNLLLEINCNYLLRDDVQMLEKQAETEQAATEQIPKEQMVWKCYRVSDATDSLAAVFRESGYRPPEQKEGEPLPREKGSRRGRAVWQMKENGRKTLKVDWGDACSGVKWQRVTAVPIGGNIAGEAEAEKRDDSETGGMETE